MSLLQIDGLSMGIHSFDILKQVSFSVEAGQIVGVIGESG